MMIKREGILLEPTKLDFENKAVFNPAVIRVGEKVHLFYRALSKENRSTIGYCQLNGPLEVEERLDKPFLAPEFYYENNLEDPRIVYLEGKYYLTYIAYNGKNVRIAYAVSKDLKNFEKKGIISPEITYEKVEKILEEHSSNLKDRYFLFAAYYKDVVAKNVLVWDKDAFLFPKKIKNKFALVHRILPDIQVIYFKKFEELKKIEFWENYLKKLSNYVLLEPKYWYETRSIGGGCPPIEIEEGWLLIFHGVDDLNKGRIYRAGAALLDKKDPTKVISHLKEPLFSPEEEWEKEGVVNNVVFPTGAAIFDEKLYIYYGAADTRIGVVSLNLNELVDELMKLRE